MPRQERAWHLGRVVGEGAGKIGHRRAPFYPPFPWCRPEKKRRQGKGGRGGGNHPQHQTRPYPCPPPSLARTTPKVRGLDGSGTGVGAGGNITPSSSMNDEFEDRRSGSEFFWGRWGEFSLKKTGEMLPFFFSFFFVHSIYAIFDFFFFFAKKNLGSFDSIYAIFDFFFSQKKLG